MAEKDNASKKTPVLDVFGVDITKQAKEGKLDPVIGRDDEIKRLGQILSRRKKNNAIIVGYPGIGKTALIQGLAQKIVKQEISPLLHNKRIIELDLAAMVAGTKYRGEFEQRLKNAMNEVKVQGNIIIFIDEIHNVIGAGSSAGSVDASNIIKPPLSNGELQMIGATTFDEYSKHFGKDGALSRRFQKVVLDPPSIDDTISILNKLKDTYENHHAVNYSNEIIKTIVKLSDRYITDRQFPDKAVDILDEVGAAVHAESIKIPQDFIDREEAILKIQTEKKQSVVIQDFETAAKLRDKEKNLTEKLENLREKWYEECKTKKIDIKESDVTAVVSLISNVPLNRLSSNENDKLLNLDKELNKRIIGQDKAIDTIVKVIRKSRLGIKKPNKPPVLLFLGSTGLGKTLSAQVLAENIFGDEKALVRVNMNEYGDKESVSRLTGAAPGYIGYEEGGELTNKIKNKPYSVVLLDEIEKAHPDVLNVFLTVFDEGTLSDSHGNVIDFRNCIFILTSNIGTQHLKDFGGGIGFNKTVINSAEAEQVLLEQLNKSVKTELINRIDSIVVFNLLEKESLYKIIDIYIEGLSKRLLEYGFKFQITNLVKDLIIEKGYDTKYGARVIERTISQLVEDDISELILVGIPENSTIEADVKDGKVVYEFLKK